MIRILTGTPGSGKSLHMANLIYWFLVAKKPVIANFAVKSEMVKHPECFTYLDNSELTPEKLVEYSRLYFESHSFHEGEIKVFIDEAQVIFQARRWAENGRDAWIRLFSQSRKLGIDVYLCCQHIDMVDKQIRTLIEYEVRHRVVNNAGIGGKVVNLICLGHPLVITYTFWVGLRERVGTEIFIGRKKYYRIYDSYKMFEGADAVLDDTPRNAQGAIV